MAFPGENAKAMPAPLAADQLDFNRQLIMFEAQDCPFCERFRAEVLDGWQAEVPIAATLNPNPPEGWTLEKTLFATPTIVLFEKGKEVSRYTGYQGDEDRFWTWLGFQILTPEQQRIAFEQGTEPAFTALSRTPSRSS